MPVKLMASVLTADKANLGDECRRLEAAGVDGIQWDVMDGQAVPSLSFGPEVVAACRPHVNVLFEAHIMVRDPFRLLPMIRDAGCELAIVHPDLLSQPWRTAERIRQLGMRCGMALSPGVPVETIRWLLDVIDQVLVMTVEPGFGGQAYLRQMEPKVAEVRTILDEAGGDRELEVDGGIAAETIAGSHRAGASTFVVGSALWRAASFEAAVQRLREACSPGLAARVDQ